MWQLESSQTPALLFPLPPYPRPCLAKNKAYVRSSLSPPSFPLPCKFVAQPALPPANTGCLGEVSNSQFPAGRVPARDFALVRALFLLLQSRPFLGRFCLCQERHKYSMRGKTLMAFAQQPSSKHLPVFLRICVEILICLSERSSTLLEGTRGREEVRLPCNR